MKMLRYEGAEQTCTDLVGNRRWMIKSTVCDEAEGLQRLDDDL